MNESNVEHGRIWLLSQELMLAADIDGSILATNPSWMRLLGWSEAELRGMKFSDLVHPEDVRTTIDAMQGLAEGINSTSLEIRNRHKDGSYRSISWAAVPDGKYLYAVGRDLIRNRGETLRQEEKDVALEIDARKNDLRRLAGVIAHDFNNVLQGIVGSMELVRKLIKMGRAEETERFIGTAMSSAKRAATLTERLQAFSNRQAFAAKPVEVNGLIESMKDVLHGALTPSITMKLAPSSISWSTLCDPKQLENSILHLVTNARDAMPDGGNIGIETGNASVDDDHAARDEAVAPGQYVYIAVTDSGTGMSQEAVQQAFEPLFTTKKTGLVCGLGLSTVYGFARQLRGFVRIQSEIGRGTTVKLYLPRHRET